MLEDIYWLFVSMCFVGLSCRQFCGFLAGSCYLSSTFTLQIFLSNCLNVIVQVTENRPPKIRAMQFKACGLLVTCSQKAEQALAAALARRYVAGVREVVGLLGFLHWSWKKKVTLGEHFHGVILKSLPHTVIKLFDTA